ASKAEALNSNKEDTIPDLTFRVPVHIWTSEGMAHQNYYVRISVPNGHKGPFCSREGEVLTELASGKPDATAQKNAPAQPSVTAPPTEAAQPGAAPQLPPPTAAAHRH